MGIISPKEEKQLRQHFDSLICDVEELFKTSPIDKIEDKRFKPETTALNNLISVAQTASCLKEVELFVQYQSAKDHKKWEGNSEKPKMYHRFSTHLLKRLSVNGIISNSSQSTFPKIEADQLETKKVWLATQYLGFVRRKYQYLNKLHEIGKHQ